MGTDLTFLLAVLLWVCVLGAAASLVTLIWSVLHKEELVEDTDEM